MDLQKYKALFVSESREILSKVQSSLLEFEQGEGTRSAVDAMFRGAHTLKGMAASMGYEGFAALAHAMEDVADIGRKSGVLPPEHVDLLLEGVDRLDSFVTAIDGDAPGACEAADLIAKLLACKPPAASEANQPPPQEPKPLPPPAVEKAPAPRPVAEPASAPEPSGTRVTQMEVRFAEGSPAPQVRAFVLRRQIATRLEVLETTPPVEDLRAGRFPNRVLRLLVRGPGNVIADTVEKARHATDVSGVQDLGPPKSAQGSEEREEGSASEAAGRTVRIKTEFLDEFIDSVGELLRARDRLRAVAEQVDTPELSEISDELVMLTKDLYDRVMLARMTPLATLTERLPRIVRDLTRRCGRKVKLSIEGAAIELDRAVLDELHGPLLHLVRNAVDHGHEGDAARLEAGKPQAMRLVIRASRAREHVLLQVEDDGGGIDPSVIRNAAVAAGLIDQARAGNLTEAETLDLICTPGFSTAGEVSDISGRGVGMDAVRSAVERLGGQLHVSSQLGRGTCFTLRLPLTLAIIGVMLVRCGGQIYAIPVNRVRHARDYETRQLSQNLGDTFLEIDDQRFPFYDLATLLGHDASRHPEGGAAVLLEDVTGVLALRVEEITGLQELVVKPLGNPLAMNDFLMGAALLADGQPAFILDVGKLIRQEVTQP